MGLEMVARVAYDQPLRSEGLHESPGMHIEPLDLRCIPEHCGAHRDPALTRHVQQA